MLSEDKNIFPRVHWLFSIASECFWIRWCQNHDVKSRNDAMLARSNCIKILHSFRLCYIWYMCDQYYAFIAIQHFIYVSTTKTTWKKNSPNCFTKKFHNARVIKKCGRNICREKTLPRTCISSFIPIVPNAIFECYSHVANFQNKKNVKNLRDESE